MMLKSCNRCKQEFPIDSFPLNSGITKTGIRRRSPYCTTCKKEYDRAYWQKTKERRNSQKKLNEKKIRERNRKFIDSHKASGCSFKNCKIKDIDMLDFDHKDPSTKSYNVSEMLDFSVELIKKEIDKCRVLCANHHRKMTAQQRRNISD